MNNYELSLWQDRLQNKYNEKNPSELLYSYYDEIKLVNLAGDEITSPAAAHNINLVTNVNGTHKITFTIYRHYFDIDAGEFVENPYINLIKNESKVKLRKGEEWLDFVIKNVDDKSTDYSVTYTGEDQFITELAKNGFNLEFATELYNNTDTAGGLAKEVLKGSDWTYREEESDTLIERQKEPLYWAHVPQGTILTAVLTDEDDSKQTGLTPEVITIQNQGGANLFWFYSEGHGTAATTQVYYIPDLTLEGVMRQVQLDDDGVVINGTNCYVDRSAIDAVAIEDRSLITTFQGRKIIRRTYNVNEPLLQAVVEEYELNAAGAAAGLGQIGDVFYRWEDIKYESTMSAVNLLTNTRNFADFNGWEPPANASMPDNGWYSLKGEWEGDVFTSRLQFNATGEYYNAGFRSNKNRLTNGISYGQSFICRIEADGKCEPILGEYQVANGKYSRKSTEEWFDREPLKSIGNYSYYRFTAKKSCTSEQLKSEKNLAMFFDVTANTKLTAADLFVEIPANNEAGFVQPEDPAEVVRDSTMNFYKKGTYLTRDEITFYQNAEWFDRKNHGGSTWKDHEKVRSLTIKESNRFNILQTICENFQCWAQFSVDHDNTGHIIYDEIKKDGKPIGIRAHKYVTFKEYIERLNWVGFRYGTNLNGITRKVDSNSMVTKTIVKANSNEFALNGSCNIARAIDNPSGAQYLLNFVYFTSQGLIDQESLNKDLYLSPEYNAQGEIVDRHGRISFYPRFKKITNESISLSDKQVAYQTALYTAEANLKTYSNLLNRTNEQIADKVGTLVREYNANASSIVSHTTLMAAITPGGCLYSYYHEGLDPYNHYVKSAVDALDNLFGLKNSYEKYTNQFNLAYTIYKEKIEELNQLLEELAQERVALEQELYDKYSRFLMEGTWNSEDYTDDNLYYSDAAAVSETSGKPQVTYNFDVINIGNAVAWDYNFDGTEERQRLDLYEFKCGDKTYIEDTEFFGWTDNTKRFPKREEVIITETTETLDQPSQFKFKVSNYKTRFEDLFHRTAAAVQSLKLQEGQYAKGASIFTQSDTIKGDILQRSLRENALILENLAEQSVTWGKDGITVTEVEDKTKMVRIVSGGIVLTRNGGETWTTGITADGMNAEIITTGRLDANMVRIMNGEDATFVWDRYGLDAYLLDSNGHHWQPNDDETYGRKNSKFVRFNGFGIYGVSGLTPDEFHPTSVDYIMDDDKNGNISFGLTWKGFCLNGDATDANGTRYSITNQGGFLVRHKTAEQEVYTDTIKLGPLDTTNDDDVIFGLEIKNKDGTTVFHADDDGNLSITIPGIEQRLTNLEIKQGEITAEIWDEDNHSRIQQNADAIRTEVTRATGAESNLSTIITQTAEGLTVNIAEVREIAEGAEDTASSALTKATTIEATVDGIETRVTAVEGEVGDVNGRLATAESIITQHAGEISSKVSQIVYDTKMGQIDTSISELDSDISGLGTRVSTAESTITQHAKQIASKVSQTDFNTLGNRVSTAESTITQQADKIALVVDNGGIKAASIVTAINDAGSSVVISADHISFNGVVDFINNGTTKINGSKITTGSITALQIEAETITAAEIESGTITGDKIKASTEISAPIIRGGTGSFTGTITAEAGGKIGNLNITAYGLTGGEPTSSGYPIQISYNNGGLIQVDELWAWNNIYTDGDIHTHDIYLGNTASFKINGTNLSIGLSQPGLIQLEGGVSIDHLSSDHYGEADPPSQSNNGSFYFKLID